MKWPWSRVPCATKEAEEASEQAKRALEDAVNFDARAERVAEKLWATKERNHFAAAVAKAIRGV